MADEKDNSESTIMVVEYNEDVAYLLKFMLEREGFNVLTAEDGRQATALIVGEEPPDLVLLDIMIPFVNGFQLLEKIKNTVGWQEVPVVMLTSKSQEGDVVRALENGAEDYVIKPFQADELLARLKSILKKSKQ
jgi:DNA-binding response OmpR family regulator